SFTQVIRYYPQVQCIGLCFITAYTSYKYFVFFMRILRHWVLLAGGVVYYNYTRGGSQCFTYFFQLVFFLKLDIYRLAVSSHYGYTNRGSGNGYMIIAHDLLSLIHHLHLFFRITVIEKYIYLRYNIQVYRISICHFTAHALALVHQLVYRLYAGAGYGLVGGYHHAVYFIPLMQ